MPHNNSKKQVFLDFKEQCNIELDLMQETANELQKLAQDISLQGNSPSVRERAAAANLTQSLYNGIENILKRTSRYCEVPLPKGEQWHSELARRFTTDLHGQFGLPLFILSEIETSAAILRRFRHVVMHGYAMNLNWENMNINVQLAIEVYTVFSRVVIVYLSQEGQQFKE